MKEQILQIKQDALQEIQSATNVEELERARVKYLGKKGQLTLVLREMGKLPKEERPIMGQISNEVREALHDALHVKQEDLRWKALKDRLVEERLDVTASLDRVEMGHRHPLMQTVDELENLFRSMGFSLQDGPEIEYVENNFDKLNVPQNHPSRSTSDTFYIDDDILLRTQTSPVQIRTMMEATANGKMPIRMVSAGKTFRFDEVDDTHSPMFHQIEGLVVDEHVSMANMIDSIDVFIKELFGPDMKTRFRPHYFPFTEPSAEVDVSCFACHGAGCPACNHTGWSMELLGCGMVHPAVLESCGIDAEKYTGFAFGMGIDRITMVKYGINDIRLLYDNDKRFLEQF